MDNTKQQLVERIKAANNVLVTVSRDPSVDALSALLGLTLVLNKQGKHAAAVFSGNVPSTLEFLQPEETIEKNTDSLRDFIIALDKSKADKLRYKVEDNVVKIFITPYKTSISQEDFEFSEGDFNIDVVIAIGVKQQEELDEAITAHGRILHDATVATININSDAGLGSINWSEPQSSSLSELITELTQLLGSNLLDEQIATALLTGIVSETDRFSNDKTSSITMSMSAVLMKAGANQQLVASKLDEQLSVNDTSIANENSEDKSKNIVNDDVKKDDGTIHIDHEDGEKTEATEEKDKTDDIHKDDQNNKTVNTSSNDGPKSDISQEKAAIELKDVPSVIENHQSSTMTPGSKLITEPPTMGGTLTANSTVEGLDPSTDPLTSSGPSSLNTVDQDSGLADIKAKDIAPLSATNTQDSVSSSPPSTLQPQPPTAPTMTPPPSNWTPPESPDPTPAIIPPTSDASNIKIDDDGNVTIEDLEESVDSPHIKNQSVNEARQEVKKAFNETPSSSNESLPPIDALNSQQLGNELHPEGDDSKKDENQSNDSSTPPPVPPPIPFQFGTPPAS